MLGNKRGEITVFLTLILVLIFALVGTMIEVARINVAKVVSERALITAMDSAAADYSVPLFKEYHLVLLDLGYDSDEINEDRAIDEIKESMEYTFSPTKDLSLLGTSIQVPNMNLLKITASDTKFTDKTSITDYNGELFINQAIEYTKYKDLTEMAEKLLEKLKLLQATNESTTLLKEKFKVDEKLLELDKYNVELMELIEGIEFNKKGIELTSSGKIKTKDYFVKKIVSGVISKDQVGVSHNDVYTALESKYVDVNSKLDKIQKHLERMKEIQKEVEKLEKEIEELTKQRDSLISGQSSKSSKSEESIQSTQKTSTIGNSSKSQVAVMNKTKNNKKESKAEKEKKEKEQKEKEKKEKEEKEKEDKIQEEINNLNMEIEAKTKSLEDLSVEEKDITGKINNHIDDLNKISSELQSKIDSALEVISKIDKKKNSVLSSLNNYEDLLKSKKDKVDEELYNNLSEEASNSKAYFDKSNSENQNGTNLYTMKQLLNENSVILDSVKGYQKVADSLTEVDLNVLIEDTKSRKESYSKYHTKELTFDYSELVLESNVKNPMNGFFSLITKGILELVLDDTSVISKKKLKVDSLYSQYAQNSNQDGKKESKSTDEDTDLSGNLESSYDNDSSEDILTSFDDYEKENDVLGTIDLATTTILNKLLFQQYLLRHFKNMKFEEGEYGSETKVKSDKTLTPATSAGTTSTSSAINSSSTNNSKTQENIEYVKTLVSALEYEQEYIITGKKSDEDNFKSIAFRIMLIRTMLNFIYIMSDKGRCKSANTTALALVGFTGLAGLVKFTEMLILLVWSYEESLVDLRALIYDKSVPLLKSKETFILDYDDMLCMNKKLIKSKVDKMKDTDKGALDFSYDDYISLFLLLTSDAKKSYRAMDLIQANMNIRYEGGFTMNHCLQGFGVNSTFEINSMFIQLPFVKSIINHNVDKLLFEFQRDYTY